jgi:hypothetical protein
MLDWATPRYSGHSFPGSEDPIIEFALHRAEETFRDGIIPIITFATDARDEAIWVMKMPYGVGSILRPAME